MIETIKKYRDSFGGYTELRLQSNHQVQVVLKEGSLVVNRTATSSGVSARCYDAGSFGFSSTPEVDEAGIVRVIQEASANARLLGQIAGAKEPPLPELGPGRGNYDYHTVRRKWTSSELLALIQEVDGHLRGKHPQLLSVDVGVVSLAMEKALVTSIGAETYSYIPRANLYVNLAMEHKGDIVEVGRVFGGFGELEDHFQDVPALIADLDHLYDLLAQKAGGVVPRAGVADVILHPDVAGILAHEAIGHTCEADLVLGGSIAGAYRGRQVASEKLTLVDYMARSPDGQASIAIHVDDEGTPCRDVTIIENGVLKGFLHSKETARIMGVEPTGNARAYRFSDEPLVRMRNTAIVPGDDTLEDMISSIDHGYYLVRPTNGQADATSEFMFGIGLGYEINNGKLGPAIRDTTVSGVAFDMLKTVTHISKDTVWSRGGMCGKKQPIPVGMGGPAIKCRISVGGV